MLFKLWKCWLVRLISGWLVLWSNLWSSMLSWVFLWNSAPRVSTRFWSNLKLADSLWNTTENRPEMCYLEELGNHFWQFSMMRSCDITSKLLLLFYVQTKNKITSMNIHTVWKCCFCVPLQCLKKYYYKLILEKYFIFNTMNDNHLCSVSGIYHGSLALCEKKQTRKHNAFNFAVIVFV